MATKENLIYPVAIPLNLAFDLGRELSFPFFFQSLKKLLEFNRRCAPRTDDKLEASRTPVSVENDELVALWTD
jgi:hypothetical protein